MPFHFSQLDSFVVRCEHSGDVTLDDLRQLKAFLRKYDGNLLIAWDGMPSGDCARLLLTVRPMLPRTAVCGDNLPSYVFKTLPGKDFYMHEVRWFADEGDALAWLCAETYVPKALRHAVALEAASV